MDSRGRCVVIGGGVGGCCTALELSDAGFTVEIVEKELDLMKRSSDATPGRMGLGFHYSDLSTACFYLHATVRFTRLFGHFRDAVEKPLNHPLRRGRYFILKSSKVPPDYILEIYEGIRQEYTKLVIEDPKNEVYGPPDKLFRLMDPKEFAGDVPPEIVEYGVETAEELLDWVGFREHILQKINERRCVNQIQVHLATEVKRIHRLRDNTYSIDCVARTKGKRSASFQFSLVTGRLVNSTWQNIAALNTTCGLRAAPRLNRVKAIATIQLPPEMEDTPSMFFCMGPHCMFSNKGRGIGMITYAPVTNIGFSTSEIMPLKLESILSNLTADEKKRAYGESILKGASRYIPKLAAAKILKVETGVVQTYLKGDHFQYDFVMGDTDFIHDPSSPARIHCRDYSGIEILAPGFVVNACMKLLFCDDNAKAVRNIFTNYQLNNEIDNNNNNNNN